jgi:hypothetical protein
MQRRLLPFDDGAPLPNDPQNALRIVIDMSDLGNAAVRFGRRDTGITGGDHRQYRLSAGLTFLGRVAQVGRKHAVRRVIVENADQRRGHRLATGQTEHADRYERDREFSHWSLLW